MSAAYTLLLPYPPSVNRYWRMARGHMHISNEGRAYKNDAAMLALSAGMPVIDGPVSLTLELYRPRKVGDIDNTMKAVLDAIKGVAYHDDSQVEHIEAFRRDDKANPRVVLTVRRIAGRTKGATHGYERI